MPVPYRIPVPLRGGHVVDTLPLLAPHIVPRSTPADESETSPNRLPTIAAIVVVAAVFVISIAAFLFLKRRRDRAQREYKRANGLEPNRSTTSMGTSHRRGSQSNDDVSEPARTSTSNIDRNTSLRSILTLPVYRSTPQENERTMGRAGERGGVDVVIELPSADNIESLRDAEMEAIYQIRLARRQQAAEREERRRLTREARERGDQAALAELRARRQAEGDSCAIDDLRETQTQIRTRRERAVSTVSYHDVGVARHDGSRIRANSSESERVGLLSDAASIALSTRSPSALSNRRISDVTGALTLETTRSLDARSPSAQSHRRMHSVGSVLSIDDNGDASPLSGGTTPRLGGNRARAGSSPEIVTEADLGDSSIPPPDYEDVSLEDARSGATTPMFREPPPTYSGLGQEPTRRDSEGDSSDTGLVEESRSRRSSNMSSRGVGGIPQLPSLSFGQLPQIVIEPFNANPER
ncbi:hypothetical protein GGS20DRAFT_349646 [Poronia punctata]|nr:hypothetical protein GGS20DRAFT_349646 [Poronia punctata]